ncbi:AAA family ATPase [Paenibacillus naphthalenovorans]|uniref:AAA family ATPase n=1 Tax=Paenibacillus naphthalenovorans TaxID=162209 RepID=UPI003D2D92A4
MPFINDKLQAMAVQQQQKEREAERNAGEIEPLIHTGKRKPLSRFKFDVDEVMQRMNSRIFGQEKAMTIIENMLKIVRADISDPDKPLFIALFMGPTGVGKTEIVRVLAEAVYGNRDHFCRVDMNTLSLDHYTAALTGSPPGYVGSKEGSTILDKEKIEGTFSRPGIVLFDEIEKASPQVIQTLLNIFDNGMITIASGEEKIDFRNAIIFMTSNVGAREMFHFSENRFSYLFQRMLHYMNPRYWGDQDGALLDKILKKKLEHTFKPEFINRIDQIITFNTLKQNTMHDIVDTLVMQLNSRLRKQDCRLELDESARAFLVEEGYDKRYGARALKRAMRRHVEVPLAELMIGSDISGQATIVFSGTKKDDSISITALNQ